MAETGRTADPAGEYAAEEAAKRTAMGMEDADHPRHRYHLARDGEGRMEGPCAHPRCFLMATGGGFHPNPGWELVQTKQGMVRLPVFPLVRDGAGVSGG